MIDFAPIDVVGFVLCVGTHFGRTNGARFATPSVFWHASVVIRRDWSAKIRARLVAVAVAGAPAIEARNTRLGFRAIAGAPAAAKARNARLGFSAIDVATGA
jgi:hypothetical protein